MNPIVQILAIALLAGAAQAGGRRYNRGVELHHSAPVYSKSYSAPLVYAKSGPQAVYAAPPVQYAVQQAVQYAPAAVQYAAAPEAHYYQAPHAHYHAPAAALTYAQPAIPAAPVALLSTAGKPQVYGKSIPAAAIRNIETVMVTKTITPVVTKTTTHHTSAEPALSVGHVQGYSQAAVGHAKLAPVQFNTQYTSYSNPTVGVNGPVVYSGAAVGVAPVGVAAAPVAAVPEPVLARTAVAAAPAVYKQSAVVAEAPAYYQTIAAGPAAYSVYPGAALSYENYGLEAHSVPVSNFLELRTGKAVLTGYHKK